MKKQCNFRIEPENEKRLEVAAKNGLNPSEVMNDLIREFFKPYIERKAKSLSQLASASN